MVKVILCIFNAYEAGAIFVVSDRDVLTEAKYLAQVLPDGMSIKIRVFGERSDMAWSYTVNGQRLRYGAEL